MARVGFSTNDHRQYWDDPATAIGDPTPSATANYKNGSMVVVSSGGSGKSGIYQLLPKYQFIANGLYQGPWGIDLGANLVSRQGFGQAWNAGSVATGDYFTNRKTIGLWSDIDKNRLPTVTSLDARLGKAFRFNRVGLNIDLDVFNLFNSGTVLGRQYNYNATGVTGFDKVLEIMNPRIMRIGARVNF
jgi:hypothetical protein